MIKITEGKKEWGLVPAPLVKTMLDSRGADYALSQCYFRVVQKFQEMIVALRQKQGFLVDSSLLVQLRFIKYLLEEDFRILGLGSYEDALLSKFKEGVGKYGVLNFLIKDAGEDESERMLQLLSASIRHMLAYLEAREQYSRLIKEKGELGEVEETQLKNELRDHGAGVLTNLYMIVARHI